MPLHFIQGKTSEIAFTQIDSSTIDGNVEFVHSQYSCILTSQGTTQFFLFDSIIINSANFRIKC